jgi:cytochrome c2
MAQHPGQRARCQRPPDPRPPGRNLPPRIRRRPADDRLHRKGRLIRIAPAVPLLLALLALTAAARPGDARRGQIAYQKCYACHALEPGRNDLPGPTLHRILGRRIAAERFDYSPALRVLAKRRPRWNSALLDRYIADPEAVAPKTSMTFTGIRDPRERADLIAYLRRGR